MKVRVLTAYPIDYIADEFCYEELYGKEEISDWEDITEEEYLLLKEWISEKNIEQHRYKKRYVLITEADLEIKCKTTSDFVQLAKKEIKEKEEIAKKRQIAVKKAAETRKKNKEEKDRKKLEELEARYETEEKSK